MPTETPEGPAGTRGDTGAAAGSGSSAGPGDTAGAAGDSGFLPAHSKQQVTLDPAARAIEEKVVAELRSCYDPEIPVNIYELGLVYDIQVAPDGAVKIVMTLTSPMCPVATSLPPDVEARVRAVPGVKEAKVEVTWEPPWGPNMMTEAARLQLNMF